LTQEQEHIVVGGSAGTMGREVIPMPSWANGKVVSQVHAFFCRYDNTTSADIRCRIRLAGGNPGASSDQGAILATATLPAAGIRYETDIKGTSGSPDPIPFLVFDFSATPVTMAAGSTYYVEISTTASSGTRYIGERLMRWLEVADYGMRRPSTILGSMRGQRYESGAWASLVGSGVEHDMGIWIEFA
jgi:hypothetical protein